MFLQQHNGSAGGQGVQVAASLPVQQQSNQLPRSEPPHGGGALQARKALLLPPAGFL